MESRDPQESQHISGFDQDWYGVSNTRQHLLPKSCFSKLYFSQLTNHASHSFKNAAGFVHTLESTVAFFQIDCCCNLDLGTLDGRTVEWERLVWWWFVIVLKNRLTGLWPKKRFFKILIVIGNSNVKGRGRKINIF